MIRCNLSTLMGTKKMKVSDVAREVGVHRNTITLLYNEEAKRIDLDTLEKLCKLFECSVCDLFEIIDKDDGTK